MLKETAAVMLCVCLGAAQAFTTMPSATHKATTTMNMLPGFSSFFPSGLSITEAPVPEECLIDFPANSEIAESCAGFLSEGVLEEEVTNGVTHALLDFGSFWSENPLLIKGLSVVGRLVVLHHMMSHGQQVLPDELVFQLGILGLSCNSLFQAANTKIEARKASLLMTGRDRLAFRSIFRSAGLTWHQFREVHVQAMSWVTVEPGQVIMDEAKDDATFWLYQGEAHIKSEGKVIHTITSNDKNSYLGLIGEKRLVSVMTTGSAKDEEQITNAKSYVAGEDGVTLLRMDMPKLSHYLKHNHEMTTSFGRLAFDAMQSKLKALRMTTN